MHKTTSAKTCMTSVITKNHLYSTKAVFYSNSKQKLKLQHPTSSKITNVSQNIWTKFKAWDFNLSSAMVPSGLANIEKSCIRAHQIQHIIRNQPIIQQKISTLNHSQGLERQQFRVPWSRPHQEHIPRSSFPSPTFIFPFLLQNLKQFLQLGELKSNVVVPNGAGITRDRAKTGFFQLGTAVVVEPIISLVPLSRMLLSEWGRGLGSASNGTNWIGWIKIGSFPEMGGGGGKGWKLTHQSHGWGKLEKKMGCGFTAEEDMQKQVHKSNLYARRWRWRGRLSLSWIRLRYELFDWWEGIVAFLKWLLSFWRGTNRLPAWCLLVFSLASLVDPSKK